MESLRDELNRYKGVTQVARKQRDSGVWASNILGIGPSKTLGIRDTGTVAQYRRLIELGLNKDARPFQLTNRTFFRLLSRDEDPKLQFEYQKNAKTVPELALWARLAMREAATAALAHGGLTEDPRVRGAAHKIVNDLVYFLRSDMAAKPLISKSSRHFLRPDATPPSIHSVALVAYSPSLQRERAGFVDRLKKFLGQPAPKKDFVIQIGKKNLKPTTQILGDPLQNDSAGRPKDLPFALHWLELVLRLDMLESAPSAQRAFARLLRDCDEAGVWNPRNIRAFPKSPSGLADFAFPLEVDAKTVEAKKADVTFRLAHLAKMAHLDLEFT